MTNRFLMVFLPVSLLLSPFILATTAAAQNKGGDVKPPIAKSADNALSDMNDLGLLRALLPLQLTAPQIAKLREALIPIQKSEAVRLRSDADALTALADDLKKARTEALNGIDPSADLEKRVIDSNKAAATRFQEARKKALETLLPIVRETLTDTQRENIEKQTEKALGGKRIPAAYKDKPKEAPKQVVQDLALIYYIEHLLLDTHMPDILAQLKPFGEKK